MENTMTILRCKSCGAFSIPPRYFCPKCMDGGFEESKISGVGKIYSFTTIYVAPVIFKDQVPYDIALIELKEGAKLTARVQNPKNAEMEIGAKVHFCGKDVTGYLFELEDTNRDKNE
jgi:uncharacterized protein